LFGFHKIIFENLRTQYPKLDQSKLHTYLQQNEYQFILENYDLYNSHEIIKEYFDLFVEVLNSYTKFLSKTKPFSKIIAKEIEISKTSELQGFYITRKEQKGVEVIEIDKQDINYDTRKAINRSNKIIPSHIIDEIESNGVTIEQLNELGVPVFIYKTQVTLHGIFDDSMHTRILGYKSLIVNQNKTLGVKYVAIDARKKELIYWAISESSNDGLKWRYKEDSTGTRLLFYESVNADDFVEKSNKCRLILKNIPNIFVGEKYAYGLKSFTSVSVVVEIRLDAIFEKNLDEFLKYLTNGRIDNHVEFQKKLDEKREIEKKRHEDEKIKDRLFLEEYKKKKELFFDNSPYPRLNGKPTNNRFIIAFHREKEIGVYYVEKKGKEYTKIRKIIHNWSDIDLNYPNDTTDSFVPKIQTWSDFVLVWADNQKKENNSNSAKIEQKNEYNLDFLRHNEKQNGIEIGFKNKPSQNIIDTLKQNGFRWSKYNKVWYAKYNKSLFLKMQNILGVDIENTEIKPFSKIIAKEIEIMKTSELQGLSLYEQFYKTAESLQNKANKIYDRISNKTTNTPKRMCEYYSALYDADIMVEKANMYSAIGKAIEGNYLPEMLRVISPQASNDDLYYFTSFIDVSGGYYSIVKSHKKKFEVNFRPIPEINVNDADDARYMYFKLLAILHPIDNKEKSKERRIEEIENSFKFSSDKGFFPTPRSLALSLLHYAQIEKGETILEPSAGIGSIADVIKEYHADNEINVIDFQYFHEILTLKGFKVVDNDVFKHYKEYDKIIMNPPFQNGADIDHVNHVYNNCLKAGGRIVAIMSEGVFYRNFNKEKKFRDFLSETGFSVEVADSGYDSKEAYRRTGVKVRIVVIEKPYAKLFSKIIAKEIEILK